MKLRVLYEKELLERISDKLEVITSTIQSSLVDNSKQNHEKIENIKLIDFLIKEQSEKFGMISDKFDTVMSEMATIQFTENDTRGLIGSKVGELNFSLNSLATSFEKNLDKIRKTIFESTQASLLSTQSGEKHLDEMIRKFDLLPDIVSSQFQDVKTKFRILSKLREENLVYKKELSESKATRERVEDELLMANSAIGFLEANLSKGNFFDSGETIKSHESENLKMPLQNIVNPQTESQNYIQKLLNSAKELEKENQNLQVILIDKESGLAVCLENFESFTEDKYDISLLKTLLASQGVNFTESSNKSPKTTDVTYKQLESFEDYEKIAPKLEFKAAESAESQISPVSKYANSTILYLDSNKKLKEDLEALLKENNALKQAINFSNQPRLKYKERREVAEAEKERNDLIAYNENQKIIIKELEKKVKEIMEKIPFEPPKQDDKISVTEIQGSNILLTAISEQKQIMPVIDSFELEHNNSQRIKVCDRVLIGSNEDLANSSYEENSSELLNVKVDDVLSLKNNRGPTHILNEDETVSKETILEARCIGRQRRLPILPSTPIKESTYTRTTIPHNEVNNSKDNKKGQKGNREVFDFGDTTDEKDCSSQEFTLKKRRGAGIYKKSQRAIKRKRAG